MEYAFIVNPNAGGGKVRARWPALLDAVHSRLGAVRVYMTGMPGEAVELTSRALHDGCTVIAAVGGDGTNNEVVNGFFDGGELINPDAGFAPCTIGTGGDFIRTLGYERDPNAFIRYMAEGSTRMIDIGQVSFHAHSGVTMRRYFLNITSFGIGGEVDERVNHSRKWLGGTGSFLAASLYSIAAFRGRDVRLRLDGGEPLAVRIFSVAVANGRYFGGGMLVAPGAELDDGLFDVVIIKQMHMVRILSAMPRVYGGSHVGMTGVTVRRAAVLEAESNQRVLIDMDGEQPGKLPARFTIVPRALPLRVLAMESPIRRG